MKSGGEGSWIWGLHAVEACLEERPELILEAVVEEEAQASVTKSLKGALASSGVEFKVQRKLPGFLGDKRTQGVAARLKHFPFEEFVAYDEAFRAEIGAGKCQQWALLDSVQDPRNYGAILRAAAAFDVQAVIVGRKDQCPLTGVVAQASAGQMFRLRILVANNLTKVAQAAIEAGAEAWALAADGEDLRKASAAYKGPLLWLVGAEGEGLHSRLQESASRKIGIPMNEGVESLNASMAAGISFYAGAGRK